MADFSKRTHASQYNSAVASGFACDFQHVTGSAGNFQEIPAGSVITLLSINVAPGSGTVQLFCGSDMVMQGSTARDYKMNWYAYAAVRVDIPDTTADVTIYFATPAKGQTAGQ